VIILNADDDDDVDDNNNNNNVESVNQNSPSFEKVSPIFLRSSSGISVHSGDLSTKRYSSRLAEQ